MGENRQKEKDGIIDEARSPGQEKKSGQPKKDMGGTRGFSPKARDSGQDRGPKEEQTSGGMRYPQSVNLYRKQALGPDRSNLINKPLRDVQRNERNSHQPQARGGKIDASHGEPGPGQGRLGTAAQPEPFAEVGSQDGEHDGIVDAVEIAPKHREEGQHCRAPGFK